MSKIMAVALIAASRRKILAIIALSLLAASLMASPAISTQQNTNRPNAMSTAPISSLDRIQKATRRHRLAFYGSLATGLLVSVATYAVWKTGNDAQQAVLDEANERIVATDAKASAAHIRADQSDKDLRALRYQIRNRTLTPEQYKKLVDTLRVQPRQRAQIICSLDDPEAYQFAKQVSRALEAAQWDTGSILRVKDQHSEPGVFLIGREDLREGVQGLLYALQAASVQTQINITPIALSGHIQLFIGPKPT